MTKRIARDLYEFADALGISVSSVRRLIKHPIDPLPYRKIGGRYLIFDTDFEKWLKRQPSNVF